MFRRYLAAIVLAVLVLTAMAFPAAAADRPLATLAHIKLSGSMGETPVAADPIFGVAGENLKSKLDRIKKARADADIQGLLLQIDEVGIGWGMLYELLRAIDYFCKTS